METTTPSPLQRTPIQGGDVSDADDARSAPAAAADGGGGEGGGRVNIKDLLLDSRQAHSGVNKMAISLVIIYVSFFKFLGELADDRFAKNTVQVRNWGLPTEEDVADAATVAEFAGSFFSRVLEDPIIDGHNRVLLAYLGLDAWHRNAYYPDAECELSSMWPDAAGKVRGQFPSELGKAAPLTNWQLPCIRDLHYSERGGGVRDTEGDLEATASDGIF